MHVELRSKESGRYACLVREWCPACGHPALLVFELPDVPVREGRCKECHSALEHTCSLDGSVRTRVVWRRQQHLVRKYHRSIVQAHAYRQCGRRSKV